MLKYSYDSSGNVTSQTAGSVLLPQVTVQLVRRVVEPRQLATFSVVVEDTSGVTFQWQFNGTDIPGATGDSLLLTNVSAANEGQYSVVITNSTGRVTSAPASLTLRRDPAVNTLTSPRLIVTSDGGGFVTVTPLKPSYNLGDVVSVTATPYPDNVFVNWAGIHNVQPLVVSINKATTIVRATFAPALPLIVTSNAGGSVTVTPMKRSYNPGEIVTLTATPFAPSAFADWTGDLSGSDNPATLTMNGNKKVRARFSSGVAALIPPGLTALWRGESDASDAVGGHDGAFFAGTAVDALPIPTPPNITALGKVGQALNFDGTVHIRVPDSAAVKPVLQMTIEVWVFPTGLGGRDQVIISRGSSDFGSNTWKLSLVGNHPDFISRERYGLSSSRPIPLNAWSHLAVTYDGLMGIKRLYVNGALMDKEIGSIATAIVVPLQYDPRPIPVTIGAGWAKTVGPV